MKAAFLYKFLSFVDWPPPAFERADSALVIGVMGAEVLANELELVVANRQVNGRAVTVRRLRSGEALAGLHMLFVGRAAESRNALMSAAKGQPLLVVTDFEDGLEAGSSINFVMIDNKVRFDVAPRHAEEANLKISSRLLAVARRVVASTPLESAQAHASAVLAQRPLRLSPLWSRV